MGRELALVNCALTFTLKHECVCMRTINVIKIIMTETFSLYILGRKYTEDIPPKHPGYDLLLPAMQDLKKKNMFPGYCSREHSNLNIHNIVCYSNTGGFLSAGCVCVYQQCRQTPRNEIVSGNVLFLCIEHNLNPSFCLH